MPLGKARNRDRMRKSRLHKQLSSLTEPKPVQPKQPFELSDIMVGPSAEAESGYEIDADGNPIPDVVGDLLEATR